MHGIQSASTSTFLSCVQLVSYLKARLGTWRLRAHAAPDDVHLRFQTMILPAYDVVDRYCSCTFALCGSKHHTMRPRIMITAHTPWARSRYAVLDSRISGRFVLFLRSRLSMLSPLLNVKTQRRHRSCVAYMSQPLAFSGPRPRSARSPRHLLHHGPSGLTPRFAPRISTAHPLAGTVDAQASCTRTLKKPGSDTAFLYDRVLHISNSL
jgi:hypothetical protein